MHKNIKNLMKSLKQLYLTDIIDEIAFKTKFLKRKTKITPELFLSLCVFGGEDLCISSLVQLKSRIENMKDITISPQALDQRFNKTAVDFLRTVFYEMLKIQNKVLIDKESLLKNHFKAIKVVDSTSVVLPESFKNTYKGCGGSGSAYQLPL